MCFPNGSAVKNPSVMQETLEMKVQSLLGKSPLEEGMATYSTISAWRIPQTQEPGEQKSMGVIQT